MAVGSADELYGVPLEEFIAERTALVKAVRASGDRDEAARIKKLPKPSVAAWTVNQLVRTQRRAIDSLFSAGDALGAAQSELLAGRGDANALRAAGRRERDARERLTRIALGLLGRDGHEPTPATLERVSETLHAAALDPDARAQLRDGCLVRELRHAGIGSQSVAPASAPPTADDRERRSKRRHGAAERAREVKQAERAAAKRSEQRAAHELRAARERLDRALEALRDAEGEVTAAQARADEAALEHRRAKDALN
jgi:hypothetical protein